MTEQERLIQVWDTCLILLSIDATAPLLVSRTSGICRCFLALPEHIPVDDIHPTFPDNCDVNFPLVVMVATYGPVTLGIGYHRWVISTKDGGILIYGVVSGNSDPRLMTSHHSELGGALVWLETITVCSITFMHKNESTVILLNNDH
jgi:hypothetical protein